MFVRSSAKGRLLWQSNRGSAVVLFDYGGAEKAAFCFRGTFSISANSLQTWLKYVSC